jgi:hypothetical protein
MMPSQLTNKAFLVGASHGLVALASWRILDMTILRCALPLESGCTIVPIVSADAAILFCNPPISYTFSI